MNSLRPGVRSIMECGRYRRVEEDSEIFRGATTLYGLGQKDMIDNILYASALSARPDHADIGRGTQKVRT